MLVNVELVRNIADAVMYEGYMLYPYRRSSLKNRQRWTFGGLFPTAWAAANGESSSLTSELLVESSADPAIEFTVRFLHLLAREDGKGSWQEATEREVVVGCPQVSPFTFPGFAEHGRKDHAAPESGRRHRRNLEPHVCGTDSTAWVSASRMPTVFDPAGADRAR